MYLTSQEQIDNLYEILVNAKEIAIDTEFAREKTYYPVLSLIQIATNTQSWIIDVLCGLDLKSIAEILTDSKIIKIIHAAGQDVEVLYHHFKVTPRNLFDTQLAAHFVGYNESPSYAKLVAEYCHQTISKANQHSDWLRRPLSASQIQYALTDVKYLIEIKNSLLKTLREFNNYDWFIEECSKYENYTPEEISISRLMGKFLGECKNLTLLTRVYVLLVLRDTRARSLNIHHNLIINDAKLLSIVRHDDLTSYALERLGLKDGKDFWSRVNEQDVKPLIRKILSRHAFRPDIDLIFLEQLKTLLLTKSQAHNIAPTSFIANRSDLMSAISNINKPNKIFTGWRNQVYGKDALELIKCSDNKEKRTCAVNKSIEKGMN